MCLPRVYLVLIDSMSRFADLKTKRFHSNFEIVKCLVSCISVLRLQSCMAHRIPDFPSLCFVSDSSLGILSDYS